MDKNLMIISIWGMMTSREVSTGRKVGVCFKESFQRLKKLMV
jgi:hypothetical protein